MDVKVGSGALIPSLEPATVLAESLLSVSEGAGLPAVVLLTDMGQPLGNEVGNALEVREAIDVLTGRRRNARLLAVTAALAGEMLVLGGLAPDHVAAARAVERALESGAAAERFGLMVAALGGPTDLIERPDRWLVEAPLRLAVMPDRAGVIMRMDARAVGLVVTQLGGGRQHAEETIDHAVGLSDARGIGDSVGPDRPIAVIHARSPAAAAAAATALRAAVTVGDGALLEMGSPVIGRIALGRARDAYA
jgi:thymidine phosphorylase